MHDEEPHVDAWLDQLAEELLRLDAARPEEIRECTEQEVRQILAECPFGSPPSAYVGFMRRFGRGAGNLFRGSDIHYPACLGLREYAEECRREEDENVPIGERFFFGHHQGYVLYCFKPEDERVWSYTLQGDGEEVAAPGFQSFIADRLAIPERFWKRFRERDEGNRKS
ncbi:hypothetical protein [Allosalinactinospora lopnorensis]|uniref:hypothetical protein n=1 Tax=Allosalinactinospora lopnorensis TaxID=1352348 RepID=UPI000695B002|nr:hypothetical protein [Allosalinactinospora lopnorensis]